MKEKLLRIVNRYGINHQQRKFMEEVFELQESIICYEDGVDVKDHITEEIADCMVLLLEMKEYYDISNEDVKRMMVKKIERTIDRFGRED